MMTISRSMLLIAGLLGSINTHAECTLNMAQTKMVKSINMMQVYNRQRITYMEQTNTIPENFETKFEAFNDRSNNLGIKFSEVLDANPEIDNHDPVKQEICDDYDQLFADYAPEGYEAKEVSLSPTSSDPNCTSESLWTKYGELIQKQAALAGKFSDAESADMMRIGTHLGEASTTDLAKACVHLAEFERIVNSK